MFSHSKSSWSIVVLLILMAAAFAIPRLNMDLYWFDEVLSIQMSGGSHYGPIEFLEVIDRTGGDRWPPLHNLVIIGWAKIFSWSEFSIRLFSLYIGMIAIAVMYRFGREIGTPSTGLIATFLLVTSAFYGNYLHEARGYTLVILFVTTSLWLYYRLLTRGGGRTLHIVFALTLVGQIYTHYVTATIIAALAVYHLLFAVKDQRWHTITRDFFYALLLFSPWIPITYITISKERLVSRGKSALVVLQDLIVDFGNAIPIYLIVLLLLSLFFIRKREIFFGWFVFIIALISALIVNEIADFLFHSRHIIVVMPIIYVLIAIGLQYLLHSRTKIIRSTLLTTTLGIWAIAGLLAYQSPTFIGVTSIEREPLFAISNIVNACTAPDDPIVFYLNNPYPADVTVDYYFPESTHPLTQIGGMADINSDAPTPQDYDERVEHFIGDAQQVWFFQYTGLEQIALIDSFEAVLSRDYAYCGRIIENDQTINYVYSQQQTLTCESPYQQTIQLEPCN